VSRVESDYYAYMGYDRDNTLEGLRHYLPWLEQGPVLELAPGRGEMLSLLRDARVPAYGVDIDEGMVEQAVAAGLDVRLGDAVAGLREVADGTLGGVFSAHFVEHLQPEALAEVVRESARALRTGGCFVAATPNAGCWSVMGHDFWRDPTHVRFYEQRLLAFYCADAGLEVVETGGNPRNAPGAPPETLAPEVHVDADMGEVVADAVRRLADPKGRGKADPDSPYYALGHVVATLISRLQRTQEELVEVRRSYQHLLTQLYPSNEVYVVARKP
jgi:SAM-dependent methyltransferase